MRFRPSVALGILSTRLFTRFEVIPARVRLARMILGIFALGACAELLCGWSATAAEPIRFNRDIRPILSDRCFACHGPDDTHREADLRLDLGDHSLGNAIVPG